MAAQFERSPELAPQLLVTAAEYPADGELEDRIERPESRFDLHVVAHDAAAIGVVQQGALVPPDPVPPTSVAPVEGRHVIRQLAVRRPKTRSVGQPPESVWRRKNSTIRPGTTAGVG